MYVYRRPSWTKQFIEHRDRLKFESELVKTLKKDNNQMIIVDDRKLSITAIDTYKKLKSRFGDKLTIAVMDYLNQIVTGTKYILNVSGQQ